MSVAVAVLFAVVFGVQLALSGCVLLFLYLLSSIVVIAKNIFHKKHCGI